MDFDGVVSKEGVGGGVWVRAPQKDTKLLSFKLFFECTNNFSKYEALILGLNTLKDLKAKRILVNGDSELVINQVKGVHQTNHPRMRSCRNLVLELLEIFTEFTISLIAREQNIIADALATLASVFKIHIYPNRKYEIEVKHRPSIPGNVKY